MAQGYCYRDGGLQDGGLRPSLDGNHWAGHSARCARQSGKLDGGEQPRGGDWGGRKGVDDDVMPQRMKVDHVRVYQRVNGDTQ